MEVQGPQGQTPDTALKDKTEPEMVVPVCQPSSQHWGGRDSPLTSGLAESVTSRFTDLKS